ncbi:MAG: MBG domain-containing protein, partial [Verrucomicrobiota bacterium]
MQLAALSQTYSGTPRIGTSTTTPSGLAVVVTYDGSTNAPTAAGSYMVVGTVAEANYAGSVTNTLVVDKAPLLVIADYKSRVYGHTNPVFTASYSGFVNNEG